MLARRPGASSRAFTFQTLYLILGSLNGEDDPAFTVDDFPLSYGVVALTIFAVGFGLVALGHLLRDRRTSRATRGCGRLSRPRGRMPSMRIYHVATLPDWKQAQDTGTYTTSTYGRTLEQEGFIHAAYHDQVPIVRDQYYADVAEPLLVLEIESDLLDAEVRDETVGDATYPHVYGPIPTDAVVAWRPARMPTIDLGTSRAPVLRSPRPRSRSVVWRSSW